MLSSVTLTLDWDTETWAFLGWFLFTLTLLIGGWRAIDRDSSASADDKDRGKVLLCLFLGTFVLILFLATLDSIFSAQ